MKNLIYILSLGIVLSACSKQNAPQPEKILKTDSASAPVNPGNPEPAKGSLSGTVFPAGLATEVRLVNSNLNDALIYRDSTDANGNFKFNDVVPGSYTLYYAEVKNYQIPVSQIFTIKSGQHTVADQATYIKILYGTISGTVSPLNAATYVIATGVPENYQVFMVGVDVASGQFKLTNVPVGTYQISFLAASQFTAPAEIKTVTVMADQNADAGSFSFTRYGRISTLTFLAGNDGRTLQGTAAYLDGNFDLEGSWTQGSHQNDGGPPYISYRLSIKLDGVTSPGTYTCKNTATSLLTYSTIYGPMVPGSFNGSSSGTGGSATVVITSIDPAANTISGTFTATVVYTNPLTKAVTNLNITNGVFNATYR